MSAKEIAVSPMVGYIPRPGWWIWTSALEVDHLVDPQGRCHTCGSSAHAESTS